MKKLIMLGVFAMTCSMAYCQWTEKEFKSQYETWKSFYKSYIKDGYKVYGDETMTIEDLTSKEVSIIQSNKWRYPTKAIIERTGKSLDELKDLLRRVNAHQIAKEMIDIQRTPMVSKDSTLSLLYSSAEQAMVEHLEKELELPVFLYRKETGYDQREYYKGYGFFVVDIEKAKEIQKNAILDAVRKFGIPIEGEE